MASAGASNEPLVGAAGAEASLERLRHLQAITEAALAHLSQDVLLDELLTRVRSILEVDTVATLLLDEEAGELVARAAKGLEEEVEARVRVPLGRGFAGRVAAERRPVFLSEVSSRTVTNRILIEKGIKALLGVPLVVEGRVIGVVHVGSLTPREFSEADAEFLQLAADRMALAIDHARLYEAERSARASAERAAERIRKLQSVTDVAIGHFGRPEELMNRLLERVRLVLATDTAAILLLEGEELVARAARGLEEEVARGVRVPVGTGFAGRVAEQRRPILIPEVGPDDVVNPLLREKGIRSLLGVPLLVDGSVIGVLHVGTMEPRVFNADDVSLLELVADRIAVAIDRARQHGVARTLQRSLLPARLPKITGLDMAARYLPGVDEAHVGGDWYDVIRLPRGRVGVVMGDVVSRGVRAAAAMGELRTALRAFAQDGSAPGVALERLNDLMRAGEEPEMATVAYVVVEPRSGEVTYSLAGHPPPLVVAEDGSSRFLNSARGGPVGVVTGAQFPESKDELRQGETLLLYTDGLVERRGGSLDEGLRRLEQTAEEAGRRPDELCDHLMRQLGSSPDDVAVLAARIAADVGRQLDLRVRARSESLSAMRRSLETWLLACGASEDEAYEVVVAVGEAGANAVEHAYGPRDAEFRVVAEHDGPEVTVSVTDDGSWRPSRGENRGRGLDLMGVLMDDVSVETGEHGTVVRMRRRLGGEGSE